MSRILWGLLGVLLFHPPACAQKELLQVLSYGSALRKEVRPDIRQRLQYEEWVLRGEKGEGDVVYVYQSGGGYFVKAFHVVKQNDTLFAATEYAEQKITLPKTIHRLDRAFDRLLRIPEDHAPEVRPDPVDEATQRVQIPQAEGERTQWRLDVFRQQGVRAARRLYQHEQPTRSENKRRRAFTKLKTIVGSHLVKK